MKRILVVDDEENIRVLYREELEEEGYTVDVAANGREALNKLNTFNPDLITLDIKMPEMDGVETLRRIRGIQRDLPVILCSAYGEYKQDLTTWASDAYVAAFVMNHPEPEEPDLLGTLRYKMEGM